MLWVGLIGAGRPTLSWDEVTTADIARWPAGDIWHLLLHVDAVFGPYYYLIHGWTKLAGNTEVDLRLPSIVAMAAAVGVAGEVGRRLYNPMVGLVTGLILCTMPNISRYAAEARSYAFTCLLSVLALLLLMIAMKRGGWWRWTLYGLSVVVLGVFHLIALTTLAAHAVLIAPNPRRGTRRVVVSWAITVVVAGLALLPVVWLGSRQRGEQLYWVDALTWDRLYQSVGSIVGSEPTAWMLVGLALLARWKPASRLLPAVVMALTPLVVVGLASALFAPMWVERYLLVVLAPVALLAAVGAVGQDRPEGGLRSYLWPALRVITVLVVLVVAAWPGQRVVRGSTSKNGPDYRSAAALIESRQLPGDAIVYEIRSRPMRSGMEYYLDRYPTRPYDVLIERPASKVGQLRAEEYADPAARLTGVKRVWLIVDGYRSQPLDGQPLLQPLLSTKYKRIGIFHLHGGTLALYQAKVPR